GPADLTATPPDQLTAAVAEVDVVTLVTYDFAGPWAVLTSLSAAIYRRTEGFGFSMNLVVSAWMESGVPASKLVVGYPLYGWGWAGIDSEEIGAASTGFAPGSDADAGVYTWDFLRDSVIPTAQRHWEETAEGAWATTSDGIFFSYDDSQAVEAKADYVLEQGLRGLNGWSLGADVQSELPSIARAALGIDE
ncbi:MAG: chitinase, partial [Bradymonadia bacterium]